MSRNLTETLLGAVILTTAAVFLLHAAATIGALDAGQSNRHHAAFNSVGGLHAGADVRMRGIKVGTVSDAAIDPGTLKAVVTFSVDAALRFPEDSLLAIDSAGLTGDAYLRVFPGSSPELLQPSQAFTRVLDHQSIEDKVSRIIFLATDGDDAGADDAP